MNPAKREAFYKGLAKAIPEPKSELEHTTPFELLVAVVLSAQATDKSVNLATAKLYPVVLLFCGVGFAAKVVFGAMYGFIPMMLIVINAIQSMNPALPKTARIMRLTKWQTLGTVVLPAMVPELVTGIRVSFSITFLGVMIGEMFGSTRGLGYILMRSININDTATIMAVTALVAVFAVAVNAGLLALDKATHHA